VVSPSLLSVGRLDADSLPPRLRAAYDWLARAARGGSQGPAAAEADGIWAEACVAAGASNYTEL
jgi:hypothetical protein